MLGIEGLAQDLARILSPAATERSERRERQRGDCGEDRAVSTQRLHGRRRLAERLNRAGGLRQYNRRVASTKTKRKAKPKAEAATDGPKTWILTGCLENFEINRERGFDVIGFKERRRKQAEQMRPGDRIIFYVTGIQAFGGIAEVTSEVFEERKPIWPQGKKKAPEAYPWRVDAKPVLVLEEDDFVPAEELVPEMEHAAKWPAEHWHLAFQGQLRTIGSADTKLLERRLKAAAKRGARRAKAA